MSLDPNRGQVPPRVLHVRRGGTSVVLDLEASTGPALVHWGEELDDDPGTLADLALASRPQRVTGGLDVPSLPPVIATASTGWFGTPGVAGHRSGSGFSVRFSLTGVDADDSSTLLRLEDAEAGLDASLEVRVGLAGLLWQRVQLRNTGRGPYTLQSVHLAFPVPGDASELLDTAGRWLRERAPQRHAFTIGSHVRESRRGRPGLDATLLLAAGRGGFGFESGRVHGIHVAWSGDHRVLAERTSDGHSFLIGGEHLAPGEIILVPGESYESPWVIGSWGFGLTELSQRFHAEWRARPEHPKRPRPVAINTWEAVRFDQSRERLLPLVEAGAAAGVERFVLDDGWSRGRRDDTAGLGDWTVDRDVWPDGLHPLVDRVRGLGLEFGLWVEPEMVSVTSSVARDHPEWLLRARSKLPPTARHQHALDLSNADAYDFVAARLHALLNEYPIAYLKWDHNRDLVDAGNGPGGAAQVHHQTRALYRLIDEIRAAHPGLEIESSASGGGRVDLGILSRTDRVWTSDSLDPIERLPTQRYTGLVVPPEMLGAHVTGGAGSVGRTVQVGLSAMVAMLCHVGIEWDITTLSDTETATLAAWIAVVKRYRPLIATGDRVDVDGTDPGLDVRGVVATDRSSAVFTIIQVESGPAAPPGRVRLPGLEPRRKYRVTVLPETAANGSGRTTLEWAADGVVLTGAQLAAVGLRPPVLLPQTGIVVEIVAEP